MKAIHKYLVTPGSPVLLPDRARILSVGAQTGNLFLWALVDPDLPRDRRRSILVVTTGGMMVDHENTGTFLGTVQMDRGFVVHVFDNGWDV